MFNQLNKYRRFLLGFLVASYLFSVFQTPLLEAVHMIGHLPQIIFSNQNVHSYHSHDQEVHQHQMLSSIENESNDSDESPLPLNEQNNKKKIEFVQSKFYDAIIISSFFKCEFRYFLPFNSTFFDIIVPPPQFLS